MDNKHNRDTRGTVATVHVLSRGPEPPLAELFAQSYLHPRPA